MTDAELLAAACEGDAGSFTTFFHRHSRAVTAFAIRHSSSADEVADVVSDVFLAALRSARRYEPQIETALPWLLGIAFRQISRQRRLLAAQRRLLQRVSGMTTPPRFSDAEAEAVESAIDAARQRPELQAGLRSLSSGERKVLELSAYDGLEPAEIAVILGLTPNAVRVRLSRARRRMRAALGGDPRTDDSLVKGTVS